MTEEQLNFYAAYQMQMQGLEQQQQQVHVERQIKAQQAALKQAQKASAKTGMPPMPPPPGAGGASSSSSAYSSMKVSSSFGPFQKTKESLLSVGISSQQ